MLRETAIAAKRNQRFKEPEERIQFNSINGPKHFPDSRISGGSVAFDSVAHSIQGPKNSGYQAIFTFNS